MKIALLNDVHIGPVLEHKGSIRAASHLVEDLLPKIIKQIVHQHSPDLLINLGDLIRSEHLDVDLKRYRTAIHHFYNVGCPVLHLIGNHELKRMSVRQVENIWEQEGFYQKNYGCMELGHLRLIWLGLETDSECQKNHKLPQDQLDWLNEILTLIKQPTFIFTHCAIDDHDLNGNFFYETFDAKQRRGFFLRNQESVQRIISKSGFVKAVFQAHLHYFHSKVMDGIQYITCPAMGDNICGPNVFDNIPEIYTLITFDNQQLSAKAFSRDYCFAGTEVML